MRRVIAVIAIVFFCLPVGLRVIGVRAPAFENRPFAAFPKLSQGWDVFDQATRFFVDRLPLRKQAVRANTWISEHVFDTTPNYSRGAAGGNASNDALPFGEPDQASKPAPPTKAPEAATPGKQVQPGLTVLQGKHGWYFLEEELGRACSTFSPWPAVIHRMERMVRIIRASGRRVVWFVPPDKSTIYPEYLPDRYPEKGCAGPGRAAAWHAIEQASDTGILGLRQTLLATKERPPDESYWPLDTHWNTKGAVLATQAVLDRLGGPVRIQDSEIVKGTASHGGDLSGLLGNTEQRVSPEWNIQRDAGAPHKRKEKLPDGATLTITTHGPGTAPVLTGRTLLLWDSYGELMEGPLASYTHELAALPWYATSANDIIAAIQSSRTVLIDKVERDTNFQASDQGVVTPDFLGSLAGQLRPLRDHGG